MAIYELRWRVAAGDYHALLDPSLPLEMMVDPGAQWWNVGVYKCCRSLASTFAHTLAPAAVAAAAAAWGDPICASHVEPEWRVTKTRVAYCRNPTDMNGHIDHLLMVMLLHRLGRDEVPPLAVALLVRLRALVADVPDTVDAAIAVLRRYHRV